LNAYKEEGFDLLPAQEIAQEHAGGSGANGHQY
jgi:hypothetical protein